MNINFTHFYNYNVSFLSKRTAPLTNQHKKILLIYSLTLAVLSIVSISALIYHSIKQEKEKLHEETLKADKLKNIIEPPKKMDEENTANATSAPLSPVIDPLMVKKTAITKELINLTNEVYVEMTKLSGNQEKLLHPEDWRSNSYMIAKHLYITLDEVKLQFVKIKKDEKFTKNTLNFFGNFLLKKHPEIANEIQIPQINLTNSPDLHLWKKHISQNQLEMSNTSSQDYYQIMTNAFSPKGEWVSNIYQKTKKISDQDFQEVEKFSQSMDDLSKKIAKYKISVSLDILNKHLVDIKDEITQLQQRIKVLEIAAQNFEKIMELAQDALPELIV